MERIRVIVIDDSAFMRKVISDILDSDERIEVIATARNGIDAIKKIDQYAPDVVTMDVQMPVMDGLEALGNIMKTNPLPIIMVSGETESVKSKTIEAMSKGAVDFIQKPSGQISLNMEAIKKEVIEKVVAAASIKSNKSEKDPIPTYQSTKVNPIIKSTPSNQTVVAIGTSTGGPRALARVLGDLPDDFNLPIFVVQHMPQGFTKSLADRLNMNCNLKVKEAVDGEKVEPKTVYIAPGNYHMRLTKMRDEYYVQLTKEDPLNGHRPSVDILFTSLTELTKLNKIAVILTGMGNDGTKGIERLKEVCNHTIVIAESVETAVIYGMPKSVVNKNKADYILPLHEIGQKLFYLQKSFE